MCNGCHGSRYTKKYCALNCFDVSLFIASCHKENMSEIMLSRKSLYLQKYHSNPYENLIHEFYKHFEQFISDNFFLQNQWFPRYKRLKSVTVGSGRVGSGRVGPVHFKYDLFGSKQTLFVLYTIPLKCTVFEIQRFSRHP